MTTKPFDLSAAINALEEPLRSYVINLETVADHAAPIRDAAEQRENARALAERVRELEAELDTHRDAHLRAGLAWHPGSIGFLRREHWVRGLAIQFAIERIEHNAPDEGSDYGTALVALQEALGGVTYAIDKAEAAELRKGV